MAISRPLLLAAALTSATAPFQCASDPPPQQAREDTPAEALQKLAADFDKAGDKAGRVRTLRFLVDQYPRSKEAASAKAELVELGEAVADDSASASASAAASAAPSASSGASSGASASAAPSASASAATSPAPKR